MNATNNNNLLSTPPAQVFPIRPPAPRPEVVRNLFGEPAGASEDGSTTPVLGQAGQQLVAPGAPVMPRQIARPTQAGLVHALHGPHLHDANWFAAWQAAAPQTPPATP